ncbi:MAG: tetratricopeptide repeat protein [Polyangiaceae bacterium]
MSKRLAYLEKVTSEGSTDSFTWYALGMEYKGLARVDDALAAFTKLRGFDPGYVPMYLMCGTLLADAQRADEAREWLTAGEATASKKGDSKALGEIREALAKL